MRGFGLGLGISPQDTVGFSPAQIPGLALWLDASDTSTIDDSTATPDVDSWTDKSSNGLVLSQSTAGKKPHTGGSINGLNVITFDGVNDILRYSGTPFSGNTGYTFSVFDVNSVAANQNMVALGDTNGLAYNFIASFEDVGLNMRVRVRMRNLGGSVDQRMYGNTGVVSGAHIACSGSNGSSYVVRVDGVDQTLTIVSGSDNGTWIDDITSLDNVTVGGHATNGGEGAYYTGPIGEVIYYDGVVLSSGQISQVETYLSDKWGIALG